MDLGDPLAQAWSVAWAGHGLLHQPSHLFEGNVGWPSGPSFAFTDSLLGYAPAGLIGSGPGAAVIRYNVLLLFTFALCFAGAALLARELGCSMAASAVAGVAFAFAPWRVTQLNHLNVLSTGGVPLSLFLLLSGYRRRRPFMIVAGWLVAAWQVSLGFALGIWFCYLLALVAAVVGVRWALRSRAMPGWRVLAATAAGGALFLLVVAFMAEPYLAILREHGHASRAPWEVMAFSSPPRGFLAASENARLWGPLTNSARSALRWPPEMSLFPGVAIVLLAAVGAGWGRASRTLRAGLAAAAVAGGVLSMGLAFAGGAVYRPLYLHLPGWSGIRTPGRLAFIWTLLLALLAGWGADRVLAVMRRREVPGRRHLATACTAAVLIAVVFAEGLPRTPLMPVPAPPPGLADVAGPTVQFPSDSFLDSRYMLWSTNGFPMIAADNAAYIPRPLQQVRALDDFPDIASVRFLRTMGYRTVVLHEDLTAGTPWAAAGSRPVAGLGIKRSRRGSLVLFDLEPAAADAAPAVDGVPR